MGEVTNSPAAGPAPFDHAKAELKPMLAKVGSGEATEFDALAEADRVAKVCGVRSSDLRGWIKAETSKLKATQTEDVAAPPLPAFATDPEPAAVPWHLAYILSLVIGVVRRRIYCSSETALACALWAIGTWGLFPPSDPDGGPDIFPRLHIFAATKRCGKSLLLEIVMTLARHPMPVTGISESAMFRAVEKYRPTLGIDEADRLFVKNPTLTSVVNSGYCRTGCVVRSVEIQSRRGKDFEPSLFSTFAPVAIAGIGSLPGTIEDRSIRASLERQPRDAGTQRVSLRQLNALRKAMEPHLMAHADAIGAAMAGGVPDAQVPPDLNDRDADNWRPLLALAQLAGGNWLACARKAAQALCTSSAVEPAGNEAVLRQVIEFVNEQRSAACTAWWGWRHAGRKAPRPASYSFVPSNCLASWLMDKDDSGFADAHDTGVVKNRLACRFRPFGLRPMLRRVNAHPTRGYDVAALRAVWRQYRP